MESYSVEAILSATDKGFTSGFSAAEKAAGKLVSSVSSATKSIGKGLTVIGGATTALGVKSVKNFGEFQRSLNEAAVIAGGTSKDIGKLTEVANRMGADLPLSAQDAADAMTEMARNGASLDSIVEMFPSIGRAATAAGSDLIQTAGVVQQAMNIWGDSIGSSDQAAASLMLTANLSNASIESMGVALASVGPNASRSGYSLNEMSAAIGLLTNQGISSERAAQNLNHAILALQAPSAITADEMERLGISVVDADGNLKSFPDTLNDISGALDGMTAAEKTASLKKLVGTSGLQAMGPLLDAINDKSGDANTSWSAFMKELENGTSTQEQATKLLQEQADEMQNNLGSKIEQVGGNWEALTNTAMESSSEITGGMLDMVSGALEWATASENAGASAIRSFVGFMPYIGAGTTAVGGFLTNISKIGGAMNGLTKIPGLGSLSDGLDKISVASGKTRTGINSVIDKTKGFAKSHVTVTNFAKGFETARSKLGGFKLGMTDMSTVFADVDNVIGKSAGGIVKFQDKFPKLTSTVGSSMSGITKGISTASNVGTSVMGGFLNSVTGIAKIAMKAVAPAAIVGIVLAGLGVALDKFGPEIDKFLTMAETKGPQVIQNFVKGITSKLPDLIASGTQMITGLSQTIATLLPVIAQAGVNIIVSLVQGIGANASELISSAITIINTLVSTVISAAPQLLMAGMQLILSLVQGLVANIGQITSTALNLMMMFIGAIIQYLPQILTIGFQILMTLIQGISQLIPQLIPAGVQMIVTLIQGLVSMLPMIIDMALQLVTALLNGLVQNLPMILQGGIQILQALIQGLVQALPQVISMGIQIIIQLVTSIVQMLPSVLQAGWDIVKSLAMGIIQAIPGVLKGAWDGIKNGFSNLWDTITGKSKETGDTMSSDMASATEGMQTSVDAFAQNTSSAFDGVGTNVLDATSTLSTGTIDNFGTMASESGNYASQLETNVTSATNSLNKLGTSDVTSLQQASGKSFSGIQSDGSKQVQTLEKNVTQSSSNTANQAKQNYDKMASNINQSMNKINTNTSQTFTKINTNITQSMNKINTSTTQAFNKMNTNATRSMNTMKNSVRNGFQQMTSSARSGVNSMVSAISSGFNRAVSSARSGASRIVSVMSGLRGQMYSSGVYAMSGLASGISAGGGGAIAAANRIANQVASTINRALKIHSPSRVTFKSGQFTGEGLELGILDRIRYIIKAAKKMTNAVTDNLATNFGLDLGFAGNVGNNISRSVNQVGDYQEPDNQRPIQVTVVSEIDGREVARTTTPFIDNEKARIDKRKDRMGGYK